MKIVIVIPGGTFPEVEILCNHLKHEVNYFDECELWLNTTDKHNIDKMIQMEKKFGFIKCVERSFETFYGIEGIKKFVNLRCKEDCLYIRLDNDIVFIENGAIKKLVDLRLQSDCFMVFGNIVNNPFSYHMYQKLGLLKDMPNFELKYNNQSRNSGEIMLKMHEMFISDVKKNDIKKYYFDNYSYDYKELQIPVNVISWFGKNLDKEIVGNEEFWMNSRPGINCVCGNALFSHLSYASQRTNLDESNLINYKKIKNSYFNISKTIKFL